MPLRWSLPRANGFKGADLHKVRKMALQWIYFTQTWLAGPFQKSRLNIVTLQIQCLLILARLTNPIAGDLIWISTESILHTAMSMGLHRDPKNFPKMSILQAETRRRLWSTILELVLQLSLDAGMSPSISLIDYDTEPPSNIDDNDLDHVDEAAGSKPRSTLTQVSFQLLLRDSFDLRLRMTKAMNNSFTPISYDLALKFSKDFDSAASRAAMLLDGYKMQNMTTTYPPKTAATTFKQNFFDHLFYRFMLCLHRPFAVKARTDPIFHYSRKICTETAISLLSYEPDINFSYLMERGKGHFRDVATSSSIAIHLELTTQLEEDIISRSVERNRFKREPLLRILKETEGLWDRRLQMGETNVKGKVFLAMAASQFEAMEQKSNLDFAIFESAKTAIASAYDVLLVKAGGSDAPEMAERDRLEYNMTKRILADLDTPDVTEDPELLTQAEIDAELQLLANDPSFNLELPLTWFFPSWDESARV